MYFFYCVRDRNIVVYQVVPKVVNFFNEVAANMVTFNLTGSLIVLGKETIQVTMNVNSHEYYYNHTQFEL